MRNGLGNNDTISTKRDPADEQRSSEEDQLTLQGSNRLHTGSGPIGER